MLVLSLKHIIFVQNLSCHYEDVTVASNNYQYTN